MPNILGRAVDGAGAPIAGLVVEIWQFSREYGLVLLPMTTATDASGRFSIAFSAFGLLVGGPSHGLQVRIKNEVRRLLWKSPVRFLGPFSSDWDLGDIPFVANTLGGWRITNFRAVAKELAGWTKTIHSRDRKHRAFRSRGLARLVQHVTSRAVAEKAKSRKRGVPHPAPWRAPTSPASGRGFSG